MNNRRWTVPTAGPTGLTERCLPTATTIETPRSRRLNHRSETNPSRSRHPTAGARQRLRNAPMRFSAARISVDRVQSLRLRRHSRGSIH